MPILEECKELYFYQLPFTIEEMVRNVEANFVYSVDINKPFVMIDNNLITA